MEEDKLKRIQHRVNSGHYVLIGDAVPWARAGYNKKNNRVYDPQKAIKHVMAANILEQHGSNTLFEGPLELIITFYMKIPKCSRITHSRLINSYHHTRPDLDNLEKIVKDICTGILYKDDCQIAQVFKKKIYAEEPKTVFTITELL